MSRGPVYPCPPSAVCRAAVQRSGLDSWTWVLACFPTGGVFTDALVTIFVCAPRPVGFCCPSPSCACFFLPPAPSPSRPLFVSGSCKSFFPGYGCWRGMIQCPASPQADHCLSLSQVFSSPLSPSSVKVSIASRRAVFAVPWPQRARAGALGGLARASRALLSDACSGDIYEGYKCMLPKGTIFFPRLDVYRGGLLLLLWCVAVLCCTEACYCCCLVLYVSSQACSSAGVVVAEDAVFLPLRSSPPAGHSPLLCCVKACLCVPRW